MHWPSGYMGIILFATFNRSNFFSDPKRAGWIAVAQIPIVVALASKNNILSWLSGQGYEKVSVSCADVCVETDSVTSSSTTYIALVVVWRSWLRTCTGLASVSASSPQSLVDRLRFRSLQVGAGRHFLHEHCRSANVRRFEGLDCHGRDLLRLPRDRPPEVLRPVPVHSHEWLCVSEHVGMSFRAWQP